MYEIIRVPLPPLTHTSNAKSDLTFNIPFIISLIVTKFEHMKYKSFLNRGARFFLVKY